MSPAFASPNPHPSPKLHLSTSTLPPHISPSQPPTKHTPFRQINSIPFLRSATLILPRELSDFIVPQIPASLLHPRFAKVICPLSAFLQGPLFNFIRTPGCNLSGVSEGVAGVDDQFTVRNGWLRLDLCGESYRRSGLQGGVVKATGARRHVGSRWRVEVDLTAGSSAVGKKGFERLRRAGRAEGGVLGGGRCWVLVCDVGESGSDGKEGRGDVTVLDEEVLGGLHLTVCEAKQEEVRTIQGVLVPEVLRNGPGMGVDMDEEEWWEVVEWLDLVALGSPRIEEGDEVDPYISRYSVPEPATKGNMRILKWEGLLTSEWLTRLLIEIVKLSRAHKSMDWVALSATGHQTEAVGGVDGYTIVLQPSEKTLPGDRDVDGAPGQTDTMGMDEKNDQGENEEGTGLQKCICFHFIDSVVA